MKIQVIIGSTRQGRQSDKLAKWVADQASKNGAEVEIVDLADYNLPMFNEPISPQYNPDRKSETVVQKWLDKISEAEGYVVVTPEYNRSITGVLKNALDYIDFQLRNKPVAIVAHGSTGGAQAVSHLRGIIPGLLAITVPQAVYFSHGVGAVIDENGMLDKELSEKPQGPQTSLQNTLTSLAWYVDALSVACTNS